MRLCIQPDVSAGYDDRRGTYHGQLGHERKEKGGKVDCE